MTIKEMEQLLDMPRASIRFYEQEGLLSPARMENGYRDYSQEDLRVLEKIRLLRALNCSVAEIRNIKEGTTPLEQILNEKIREFDRAAKDAEASREICVAIRESGARFENLDAGKYLRGTWAEEKKPVAPMPEKISRVPAWHRYWARMLDWQLYSAIWSCALFLAYPPAAVQNANWMRLTNILVPMLVMILLEPFLLHFCGATPGKWILGISVRADEGGKLSISQARERAFGVLGQGLAWNIPIWQIKRMWNCYTDYTAGIPLSWEYESYLEQKKFAGWRWGGYMGMRLVILAVVITCMGLGRMCPNRGEITVAQFAQNYNKLVDSYGYSLDRMNEQGEWVEREPEPGVIVIDMWQGIEPQIRYDAQFGAVQGFEIVVSARSDAEGDIVFLPTARMGFAAAALCGSDSPWLQEILMLGSSTADCMTFVENSREFPAKAHVGGWALEMTVERSEDVLFTSDMSAVVLPEGSDSEFTLRFTVRRREP